MAQYSADRTGPAIDPSAAPRLCEWRQAQRLPALAVYCLGPFRVYQNDRLIREWSSLKSQSILRYLVAHWGKRVAKDVLMDVFWPNADPDAARRNLHQAVYSLRQTLKHGQPDHQYVQFESDSYFLDPDIPIWLDFEEFEKRVQAGRRLESAGEVAEAMIEYGIAEGLYRGDFLEEELYEDWPRPLRESIRATYLCTAGRLSEHYAQLGEHSAAMLVCRRVLTLDRCSEEAHRRLMQCYLAQGQRHLAVEQYQVCVEALQTHLSLAPSAETQALYRLILAAA